MLTQLLLLSVATAAPPKAAALGTVARLPRSVVSADQPKLVYLEMKNRTGTRIYFEDHATGACFADKFADIQLNPPAEPKPVGECTAASKMVMPEAAFARAVDLNELYVLTAPSYTVTVTWKDGGPDVYSPTRQSLGTLRIAEPFFQQRLKNGDSIFLPNNNTLELQRQEWKAAERRGEPGRLVLHFNHIVRGKGESPVSVSVLIDQQQQVNVDGYVLDVGDYQLNQWVDVKLFEPG